jgi:serine/threonine protein kinase
MPYPSPQLTKAPDEVIDKSYQKQPSLLDYNKSSSHFKADLFFHEAQICERLMANPHPNICQYYGYLPSADGRIAALCLKCHGEELYNTVKEDNIDASIVISQVRSGIQHLHSLGLVHVMKLFHCCLSRN